MDPPTIPSQPTPQVIPSSPPQRSPSILLIITFLIIILLIGLGGYYLGLKQAGKLSPTPSTMPNPTLTVRPTKSVISPIDIKSWKTYMNDVYKFSFNYPENLQVKENNLRDYKSYIFSSENIPPFSSYFNFTLIIHTLKDSSNLKNWLDNYVIQPLPGGNRGSIVSGSILPYKNTNISGYYFVGGKESIDKYVFFQKDNYIYQFSLSGSGTGSSYKENPNGEMLLDQILSTFKFIKQECKIGEYLKQCKLGPCCCPTGAICD